MTHITPNIEPLSGIQKKIKQPFGMSCDISVIICTYNRAEMLRETLASWRSVKNAGSNVELVIVDNNSTDHTQKVVESFLPACPSQFRYVFETHAGLSRARNRGIEEASGQIIAFVDDDVYFDKEWLNALLKVFNDNPEISCAGGRSIPKFDGNKPDWITEDILRLYGSTNSGDQDRLMIFPEHPFGLNMAFRKEVFTHVGNFNINLGRIKSSLMSNEERDIFYRISKVNLKVFYASKAILHHRIPKDRMDKRWVVERTYWQAISDIAFLQLIRPKSKLFLSLKTIWILINIFLPPGRVTPKSIYQYYKYFSFEDKLKVYHLLGIAKQNLNEIFAVSK